MPPSRENGIFDDVMITVLILSDKSISKANFTFLVKSIIGIVCTKNCKNMFTFVKVI